MGKTKYCDSIKLCLLFTYLGYYTEIRSPNTGGCSKRRLMCASHTNGGDAQNVRAGYTRYNFGITG